MSSTSSVQPSPPSTTPVSTLSHAKLSKVEVFAELKKNICSVTIDGTKSSGFFLSSDIAISTFHSATGMFMHHHTNGKVSVDNEAISVRYDGEDSAGSVYYADHKPKDMLDKSIQLDLLGIKVENTKDKKVFPLIDFELKEGMTVYYGGFPLSQSVVTLHKGTISSIDSTQDGVSYFTIDGTVVPGNSGGPVLVQKDGELYLAGVMVAEVADLDPEFHPRSSTLSFLADQDSLGDQDEIMYDNGTFQTFSRDQQMMQAILQIQKNISTGIGKAIDARAILRLFDINVGLTHAKDSAGEIQVGLKKDAVRRTYGETSSKCSKYRELAASGKGPRTIRVNMDGKQQEYKIKNPHQGNYNKYHGDFYLTAAEAIEAAFYKNNNTFAPSLTLSFHSVEYSLEAN